MSQPKFDKAQAIIDFPAREREIAEFWKDRDIFKKSLEIRKGAPQFTFYEGPPTANGLPHNGHVLTRVFKDVFLRYRTMCGQYVPRKAGWDTHGLPVEVEVEKELGIHGKEAIEEYGVEPFIVRCIESVFRYTEEWERMTEKVGFWADLQDAYVTYQRSYVESVWWALSELVKKDLLYKGHKIVWWWPQGGTALSAGEVGQGYKEVEDPSVFVTLPLTEDPSVALLIWTTTPWTLPSNQYAVVKPDFDYVQVKDEDRSLIIAAALRETIEKKIGRDLPIEKEFKGADLLGKTYRPPFDYFLDQYSDLEVVTASGQKEKAIWKVVPGEFVELDSGTGLVHAAPAFGEVDFELHRDLVDSYTAGADAVPLLCPVKPDGKFTDVVPDVAGVMVKDADKQLIRLLKERGLLLHREQYKHDYPFCWRADSDPLIQYARPAWFIKTTARNKEVLENNDAIRWLPEHIGPGRFGDFLRNNVDWALSRERFWGTPLNIWINDESGKMQSPASADEILAKNPNAFDHWHTAKAENPSLSEHLMVHKPWIDAVTWEEPGEAGVYRRVPEVIDCWFDSGCMPFAQWGFPHQGAEKFNQSFPADYITEAIDQTRGWFYSQVMIATLLFDKECQQRLGMTPLREYPLPFKTCLVLGHVNDPSGKKESKSKGNYTPPNAILDSVAQDFAVVTADDCGQSVNPGEALIAREDLEALDLKPGQIMKAYLPGTPDASIELAVKSGKKMPRRVVVLADSDRETLAATINAKGKDVTPNEVPWLPVTERVTIESPVSSAPGADAFRWFFLASSAPWNTRRHSLANVRTIQKDFPLKLRNVYSFFTIYANIDGFDPAQHSGQPVADRALLDRWILSELELTIRAVRAFMDDFHAYEAAVSLGSFVDALSNWYLRRSRARYWKSEFDADKQDAYATLYECLTVVTKLAAPFTPFMAEEIYRNIVCGVDETAPESVHLADMPTVDESRIDHKLSEEMALVRNVVSLGLRVRTEHKIKVRQPLASAEAVISDADLRNRVAEHTRLVEEELNVHDVSFVPPEEAHVHYVLKPNFRRLGPRLGKLVKAAKQAFADVDAGSLRAQLLADGKAAIEIAGTSVPLEPEDVEILVEASDNFAAAGDNSAVVVLNTEHTPELLDEGLAREILRRIQDLRKDHDVDYTERICVHLDGSDRVKRVAEANRDSLMAETLCTEFHIASSDSAVEWNEHVVDDEPLRLALVRTPSK